MTNIAHRFLRNDKKHADIYIKSNGGSGTICSPLLTISKDSITGSNKYFIGDTTNRYLTSIALANTDGTILEAKTDQNEIQFNTFSLAISNASNLFDESLGINITPYNLVGAGNPVNGLSKNATNGNSLGSIRIDTVSITALASITGSFGTLVRSGSGQFPFYGSSNSNFGNAYDHEQHVGSGAYVEDMIMYQGVFAPQGSGYRNYTSGNGYYVFNGVSGYNYPDYSSLSSSFRYITFKYASISGISDATITITGTNFTNQIESNTEMELFIRIEGSCGWLNANASMAAIGVGSSQEFTGSAIVNGNNVTVGSPTPSQSNYNTDNALNTKTILIGNFKGNITSYNGTTNVAVVSWDGGNAPSNGSSYTYRIWKDGVTALQTTGSYISTGTKKYVKLPNASGDVYIRLGLSNTSNKTLTKIKFQTGFN